MWHWVLFEFWIFRIVLDTNSRYESFGTDFLAIVSDQAENLQVGLEAQVI